MILSRAKPAIGGEKAEEKGGSAGRKQVFLSFHNYKTNIFFLLIQKEEKGGIAGRKQNFLSFHKHKTNIFFC